MSALEQYIYKTPLDFHKWGDTFANPRIGFRGETDMPGARLNYGFTVVMKPHIMDELHFHHGVEEYLVFTGTDLVHPEIFDAEIDVDLGEDPDNVKTFTITEPTVVRIPEHLWHCPIHFRRVTKPVNFMPMYLDGTWTRIMRRFNAEGTPEFVLDGEGFRYCVFEKSKTCTYCGRCFREMMEKPSE